MRRSIGAKRNPASAEAILEAAEAVLLEEGYARFSIEAVARRARAGKPTIYRWWPSKAALLLEIYHRQKRIENPDTGNIADDLFLFLKSLFKNWRDTSSGNVFRSIIAEAQSDEAAGAALAAYRHSRCLHVGKMVERAKQRGEVVADVEPTVIADLVASYAWVHLLTDRLGEDENTTRIAVNAIVRGILTGSQRDGHG